MINFNASKAELAEIIVIAERALVLVAGTEVEYSMKDALMDIEACHCNGCRLKLSELANAKQSDLAHDVYGIRRHLNRKTGELEDCFLPRYAA